MPPQKQMLPSTTHSFRCRRRHRPGSSTCQPRAGLKTRHLTPAAFQRCLPVGRDLVGADAVDDHLDA